MHLNTGQLVFIALVALGVIVGLILALANRSAEPETEQDWLDRQY